MVFMVIMARSLKIKPQTSHEGFVLKVSVSYVYVKCYDAYQVDESSGEWTNGVQLRGLINTTNTLSHGSVLSTVNIKCSFNVFVQLQPVGVTA